MLRHTLAVRSLWCLAAAVQLQASPPRFAPAVRAPIVMDDELPPLVVPVARGLAPYGLEVVWRAFTTGDTTPSAYRAKYTGRACENTQFFLRREFGGWQPCRALVLAPWLEMVGSMPDAILARRVVLFADSTANLASVADSTGRVNAVVAAVAGDRGATRLIAVNYSARRASRPVTVEAVIIVPLATESREVTEEQLIVALPYVLGLSPHALFRDQRGVLHLHPDAFSAEPHRKREALLGPKTLKLDADVHSCGSMSCIVAYPTYIIRMRTTAPTREVYITVRHGEGVLIEAVRPLADLKEQNVDSIVSGEWTLFRAGGGPTELRLSPHAALEISWRGQVATIVVPQLR